MEEIKLMDFVEIKSVWIKDLNERKDVKMQDKIFDSSVKLLE